MRTDMDPANRPGLNRSRIEWLLYDDDRTRKNFDDWWEACESKLQDVMVYVGDGKR